MRPPHCSTAADEQQLRALVFALVRDWDGFHRLRCVVCQTRGARCPHLVEAIEAVPDWRESRETPSKATWHRRGEDAA
jgi:hypothetical protein